MESLLIIIRPEIQNIFQRVEIEVLESRRYSLEFEDTLIESLLGWAKKTSLPETYHKYNYRS